MAASHYKLDNLCVVFDLNHLQIDGRVEDVIDPLPLKEKLQAFNLEVFECDGNDFESIAEAFANARKASGKPCAIVANTVKGKGVSFMENNPDWHGKAPSEEQFKQAMEDLKEVC